MQMEFLRPCMCDFLWVCLEPCYPDEVDKAKMTERSEPMASIKSDNMVQHVGAHLSTRPKQVKTNLKVKAIRSVIHRSEH